MAARRNFRVERGPRIGGSYPLAGRFFSTEYEYQQARSKALGFESYGGERGAKQRAAKNPDFQRTLNDVRRNLHLESRPKDSARTIELQLIALQEQGNKQGWSDKTPNGPLAQILVMKGLRNARDSWNVGETPQWAKRSRSA